MTDLTQTIIPKSDQMNADDLICGRTVTIKITKVTLLSGDQPVSLNYEGDNGKPYKPCKSMRRVLVQVWGKDGSKYIGRSMTLYCDPKVTWGGKAVGGIRISHMSDIDKDVVLALTTSKANRKPYTVKPLKTDAPDPELLKLRDGGQKAAEGGESSYVEWKDKLTPEQKNKIAQYHIGWAKIAVKVDAKSKVKTEEPAAEEETEESSTPEVTGTECPGCNGFGDFPDGSKCPKCHGSGDIG